MIAPDGASFVSRAYANSGEAKKTPVKRKKKKKPEAPKDGEHAPDDKSKQDKPKEKRVAYSSGILLGKVGFIDPNGKYLFVTPRTPNHPRSVIFMDKQTKVSIDGEPAKVAEIHYGQRVAVRFVAADNEKLADEVFLVEDFEPVKVYERKRR